MTNFHVEDGNSGTERKPRAIPREFPVENDEEKTGGVYEAKG